MLDIKLEEPFISLFKGGSKSLIPSENQLNDSLPVEYHPSKLNHHIQLLPITKFDLIFWNGRNSPQQTQVDSANLHSIEPANVNSFRLFARRPSL
jgi:hypothetical protein